MTGQGGEVMASRLQQMDVTRAELAQQFPGWQVWYVPALGGTTWCARPWPLLNCPSPEHLAAAITEAHNAAAADWPALANRADYAVTAPGIPQAECW